MIYKMVDENWQTHGSMQWGIGVEHCATGDIDQPLCSDAWIHVYENPLLAVLLNPIHADFKNPHLCEVEGIIELRDGQLKAGYTKSF